MKTRNIKKVFALLLLTTSLFSGYLFFLTKSPEPNYKMWSSGILTVVLLITSIIILLKK